MMLSNSDQQSEPKAINNSSARTREIDLEHKIRTLEASLAAAKRIIDDQTLFIIKLQRDYGGSSQEKPVSVRLLERLPSRLKSQDSPFSKAADKKLAPRNV